MQPNVLQLLSRLRDEKMQNRGLSGPEIAELLKLKGARSNYQAKADESLGRAKGLAGEIQETSGEVQSVFSDVPAYKRPQREGVSKGSMNFGLLLGGLGALAGVDDPQNLTGTAIGGQKTLKDQEYADELDTLRERMDADREARMGKVEGLRAKLGGLEAGQRFALTEADVSGRKAMDIGSEVFQRTQVGEAKFAESERNRQWWTSFNWTKDQAKQAQENWQKGFDLQNESLADRLAKDEAGFVSKGIDPETARMWAYGSVMANAAQAEMATEELGRKKKLYSLISPEREAQQELWRMDFETRQGEKQMKLLDAQIASAGRANRPDQARSLGDAKLGLAVGNIDRTQALIDAAEQTLNTNFAKFGDPDHKSDANEVRRAIGRYKADLIRYMKQANDIQPGLYDTATVLASGSKWLSGLTGGG